MTADPWALFGSDSDEAQAESTPSKRPLPTPPVATANPNRSARKKSHLWEALLPKFHEVAIPEGGAGFQQISSASPKDSDAPGDECLGEGTGVARAPFSAPPVYQHPYVRYEACLPHRGGGRGFMASKDIDPGTLLLVERRYLPMPTAIDCGLAGGVGQEELCLKWILALPLPRLKEVLGELRWLHPQKLEDLPAEESESLMTRHEEVAKSMILELGERSTEAGLDARGIVRLFGALQSNGFASGIYLHPAMTNHSCRANAIKWQAGKSMSDTPASQGHRLSRRLGQEQGGGVGEGGKRGGADSKGPADSNLSEIRATELIRAGEEITISYLEPREIALASRQTRLKDQFGFDCDCRLCHSSSATSGCATPLEAFVSEGRGEPGQGGGGGGGGGETQRVGGARGWGAEAGGAADSRAEARGGEGGEREGGAGEEEEDEDGADDASTRGAVAMNVLERRLEATESVVELSKAKEVRWAGVLSELLSYRLQAKRYLGCRHIALARADKLIAKACVAILQGSTEEAGSDTECAEMVRQASDELPASFGGEGGGTVGPLRPMEGSFKTRLVAVFLGSLLSRRKTQLLYLGDGPHPEAGACLADLSQAMGESQHGLNHHGLKMVEA
eukprot:jgi/Undpi1/4289/HiC_scaffold_17.g07655.m1